MALGWIFSNWKKNFFFLKFFFKLWKRCKSSGGWSHGWKVFWGLVSYNIWYNYNFNFNYSIWNIPGIIQIFFKNLKMNFTSGLVFYPSVGIFTLNQLEHLHDINTQVLHSTLSQSPIVWTQSFILKNANIGIVLFSIQTQPYKSVKFARSAGCYGKIIKQTRLHTFIQLPSLIIYIVSSRCSATAGLSSKKFFWKFFKAGHSWYMFWIPKVWGIAMNPVDHPHGGRTNKGGHPKTPTGWLTKGVKTRKRNGWSKKKIYNPKKKIL